MPGKQEAHLAHDLGAALRAELACDVRVEQGIQGRVRATVGDRSANVLCFWYDSAGTTSPNECYGWVEPGVPRTAGGEYAARSNMHCGKAYSHSGIVNQGRLIQPAGGRLRSNR